MDTPPSTPRVAAYAAAGAVAGYLLSGLLILAPFRTAGLWPTLLYEEIPIPDLGGVQWLVLQVSGRRLLLPLAFAGAVLAWNAPWKRRLLTAGALAFAVEVAATAGVALAYAGARLFGAADATGLRTLTWGVSLSLGLGTFAGLYLWPRLVPQAAPAEPAPVEAPPAAPPETDSARP